MPTIHVQGVEYLDTDTQGREQWVRPNLPRTQRDTCIRATLESRHIPLGAALEALREHARSEVMHRRMGCYDPNEDGVSTIKDLVDRLARDVELIYGHICDFGEDRDTPCCECGLDPRS